jgi:hypothetical protein
LSRIDPSAVDGKDAGKFREHDRTLGCGQLLDMHGSAMKIIQQARVETWRKGKANNLEIIAAVLDPTQIARYLKHTGKPAAPPARAGVKMRIVCDEWC